MICGEKQRRLGEQKFGKILKHDKNSKICLSKIQLCLSQEAFVLTLLPSYQFRLGSVMKVSANIPPGRLPLPLADWCLLGCS